jgi:hypothetical protein
MCSGRWLPPVHCAAPRRVWRAVNIGKRNVCAVRTRTGSSVLVIQQRTRPPATEPASASKAAARIGRSRSHAAATALQQHARAGHAHHLSSSNHRPPVPTNTCKPRPPLPGRRGRPAQSSSSSPCSRSVSHSIRSNPPCATSESKNVSHQRTSQKPVFRHALVIHQYTRHDNPCNAANASVTCVSCFFAVILSLVVNAFLA